MSDGGKKFHRFNYGTDLASGTLYFYSPGTTNAKNAWSDEAGTTPIATLSLDSRGQGKAYLDGLYRVVAKDSGSVTVYDDDDWRFNADPHIIDSGTAYSSAATANRWHLQVKHTAGNVIEELGVNDGTAFRTLITRYGGSAPYVDLRAYLPEGFVTDGSVDYTTEIQNAINSYGQETGATASGGIVFFPSGTFKITAQLSMYSGVHIVGSGTQATIINANEISSGGYAFKNVNNARYFSYRDFTIIGASTTTAKGGISIGNDSGDAGFTAYCSLSNIDITDFSTTGAIGLLVANPSHVTFSNVDVYTIPNGEACVVTANMTNTGVFHFASCKFGEWTSTDTGLRLDGTSSASAALSEIVFDGCFFGGTTRSVNLKLPVTAGSHRNIRFDTCHHETDNATAGSECVLVENGRGLTFVNNAFHGNANTANGIRFNHAGEVAHVRMKDNQFVNLSASGTCIKLESGGAGSYRNVIVDGILTKNTDPVLISDPNNVVTLMPITVERDNSDVSTSGTGEDQLNLTTIPQKTMGTIGKLRITASGTKTGSAGNKIVRFRWGSTDNFIFNVSANNTNDWKVEVTMENTAVDAQRVCWVGYDGATVLQGYETSTIDTDTTNMSVWVTGECIDGADTVTQTMWHVERYGS